RPKMLTVELIVKIRKFGVPPAVLRCTVNRFAPSPLMLMLWFMSGSALVKLIVFGVLRLKLILIVPLHDESAFASSIAARKVQTPLAAAHKPLPGVESLASPLSFTVNAVGQLTVRQLRNKIDTSWESALATARSCLPSPLLSGTATEAGPVAAAKLAVALKLPAPLPKKIDTLFEP